jgi:hypothetical protein
LDGEGKLTLVPEDILEVREKKLRNRPSKSIWSSGRIFLLRMLLGKENMCSNIPD